MPDDRLDGWKEISSYLNRGVRTVQRWEQDRKLPIRRIPSTGNSHHLKQSSVYALASELDRWMMAAGNTLDEDPPAPKPAPNPSGMWSRDELPAAEARSGETNPGPEAPKKSLRLRRWLASTAAVILVLLAIAAVSWWVLPRSLPNPVSADLENRSRLVVFNAAGRPLWSRQFVGPLAETSLSSHSLWQLSPLDGDGRNAVLFFPRALNPAPQSREMLLCLNPDGGQRWQYSPGYRVTWGGIEYLNDFRLHDFSATGKAGQAQRYTVVVANHVPFFPSQVSTVNAQGTRIGDYWNTGHVLDHCTFDLDGDGIEEILIGGSNKLRGRAFWAVIPHDLKRAISPVPENYAPSFATCREIAYFEFPVSDVSEVLQIPAQVRRVCLHERGYLRVETEIGLQPPLPESVRYIDLSDFRTTRMEFTQQYASMHHQLRLEKKLDHDVGDPAETEIERTMQPVRMGCGALGR